MPAFTIMELMVVSLLSVLAVAAAFQAIEIIQNQLREYTMSSELTMDKNELNTLLKEDCFYARHIVRIEDSLFFAYDRYWVKYEIGEAFIVREMSYGQQTFALPHPVKDELSSGQASPEGKSYALTQFIEQRMKMNFDKNEALAMHHSDTFNVEVAAMRTSFNNRERMEGVVSEIDIDIAFGDAIYPLALSKALTAKSLVENSYGN